MPVVTVKTEFIKKLKELGIYDQWLKNVKDRWNDTKQCRLNPDSKYHVRIDDWYRFIDYSFLWYDTSEGHEYWRDIADKYK